MRIDELEVDPNWPTDKIFYRGFKNDRGPVEVRSGISVFVTDNVYQAASYAGPNGKIAELTLSPVEVIEVQGGTRFSPTQFDDKAARLFPGTVLVAKDIVDSGPYADELPNLKHTYGSTHVAFKQPYIASVKNVYDASKFFE